MRTSFARVIAWLGADDKAKAVVAVLQILAASLAFLYLMEVLTAWRFHLAVAFCVVQTTLVVWFGLVLLLTKRFGLNVLTYEKATGVLFDRWLNIENVAFRRDTLHAILEEFVAGKIADREAHLKDTARKIGISFVEAYKSHQRKWPPKWLWRTRHSTADVQRRILNELLDYDSSSGLGKFTLREFTGNPQEFASIDILNPFSSLPSNRALEGFILGYLEGVFGTIFERDFTAVVTTRRNEAEGPLIRINLLEK